MGISLRQLAKEMDRLAQPSSVRVSDLIKWHRWKPDARRSCREVARRHSPSTSVAIRFLSYNTYLLKAKLKLPDPFRDVELKAKPEIEDRARELGRILRSDYDLACLYEIMEHEQKSHILEAWGSTPPAHILVDRLTSLLTISQRFPIVRHAYHKFSVRGKSYDINLGLASVKVSLDSDFYADKGVLLTEIETPCGNIEIYSTHLMFGGGLGDAVKDILNIIPGDHMTPSNSDERLEIELQQIDELIAFYNAKHVHHPKNVALVCGDFNIDASDQPKYERIRQRFEAVGMRDAWAEGPFRNQLQGGQTARNDDGDESPKENNFENVCVPLMGSFGDLYCDDTQTTISTSHYVGRFDLLFVQDPDPVHDCNLDVARVRRRAFQRPHATNSQQGFLSDHLGLDTTLFVSQKHT